MEVVLWCSITIFVAVIVLLFLVNLSLLLRWARKRQTQLKFALLAVVFVIEKRMGGKDYETSVTLP